MKKDRKMMGPMFPRLLVNEREKGGPRAPPRNKMALYEQLSIPSQRFNSGLNHNQDNSSAQGNENKRPRFSPIHQTHLTHLVDNSNATSTDFNTTSAAPEWNPDEEDFSVPVFAQSESGQNLRDPDSMDRDNATQNVSFPRPALDIRCSRIRSTCNKEPKQDSAAFSRMRQKDRHKTGKPRSPPEEEDRELFTTNVDRFQSSDYGSQLQNASNEVFHQDKTGHMLGVQSGDRCDDNLNTTMLDTILGVDISPDDVVELIGQKHFWEARRAIINQQRVFAVQVFELHRIIKVQRFFAGSPNLLLEDAAYLGKRTKVSIPKELSLEFIIKQSPTIEKPKEDQPKNPIEEDELSIENAVGKGSLSSLQNISHHHPSSEIPFPSDTQPTPVNDDPKTNPGYFNHPTGHHWLVPFMSPTEGLIYKPYPGPGDPGSNPMISHFSNHPYGIPNHNPYFPHGFPSMSHAYFSPYGSAVDQGNHFTGASFTEQQKNLCNGATQKNNVLPNAPNFVKARMGNESGVQVSIASSPGEGTNGFSVFPSSPDEDMATDNHTRVIKAVPHNAVSASESASRIFQSIQKEREQFEFCNH